MNLQEQAYARFHLVREMMETPELVGRFDPAAGAPFVSAIDEVGKLFLTGEGSSRIFPAKNCIAENLKRGGAWTIVTEGARQAHEYRLESFAVFGASNSGRTKELISLFRQLQEQGHARRFGLTATAGSTLTEVSQQCFVLGCGKEEAVAATKSVVEQALFYLSLLAAKDETLPLAANRDAAAAACREVLESTLDASIVEAIAAAPIVYFAGRNNGVAEELTLKTNEITRKKSDYLEGTYAVHGIEEVMNPDEVVLVVDPYPAEVDKFREVLVDGVGLKVFAIASKETGLPTIKIPSVPGYDTILQLLAGWNVLVEVGVKLGIDLDKPQRARKVGNEVSG
ncbi:hypothetical protein JCM19992_06190 [Thermostilla marina]